MGERKMKELTRSVFIFFSPSSFPPTDNYETPSYASIACKPESLPNHRGWLGVPLESRWVVDSRASVDQTKRFGQRRAGKAV